MKDPDTKTLMEIAGVPMDSPKVKQLLEGKLKVNWTPELIELVKQGIVELNTSPNEMIDSSIDMDSIVMSVARGIKDSGQGITPVSFDFIPFGAHVFASDVRNSTDKKKQIRAFIKHFEKHVEYEAS